MATIPMSRNVGKTVRTEKLHRIEVQNSEQGAPSKSKEGRRGGVLKMRRAHCASTVWRREEPVWGHLTESVLGNNRQREHSYHCFPPLSCAFVTSIDMTLQEMNGRRKVKFVMP